MKLLKRGPQWFFIFAIASLPLGLLVAQMTPGLSRPMQVAIMACVAFVYVMFGAWLSELEG